MKKTADGRELNWYYESAGRWVARSEKMTADDCILFYRITVEKTGLFSLGKSDGILNAGSKMFATLKQAQLAADVIESQILRAHPDVIKQHYFRDPNRKG